MTAMDTQLASGHALPPPGQLTKSNSSPSNLCPANVIFGYVAENIR